ncbi:helix-turn-helix domain-containing protein [Dysgonomonas sp. ZJ709]|uniref:helix-turn-helix domain-containing protein n=1 Tax=Dysgonomonas sp. ZJ709 TaxID=2709797 RepID=UPI0013EB5C77|nr:helix-turn-helix domain-containing protein [Dysgonomonas sp. ZJ709]
MGEDKQGYISSQITIPSEFEDVFTYFYVAENRSDQTVIKTLLPSFQTILIFSFGNTVNLKSKEDSTLAMDKCVVLGPIKRALDYSLSAGSAILVANFKEDAFYRFFGQVISLNLAINPDELIGENCFTHLWHSLNKIKSSKDRVDFILDFCRPYLKNREPAFVHFSDTPENNNISPIKAIAQATNKSERMVQLNHKKFYGYTAKEVTRYKRFLLAIELLQTKSSDVDWFEIINTCNYYDQSQLIHDFKYYIKLTPTQYLKFQHDICKVNKE